MSIRSEIPYSMGSPVGNAMSVADLTRRVTALENQQTVINAGTITGGAGGKIAVGSVDGTNIAPASISTGNITAGAITSALIAAGAIQAVHMSANSVTAGTIAAGAIVAGTIAAGAIGVNELAANAVTTVKIAAGAVTASSIATGTITATQLAADSVTATQIAASAVSTSELAANSITSTHIQSGQITSTLLAANAVTATAIATGAVTSTKISVTQLDAISANMGAITSGSITGATVQTASSGARVVMNSGGLTAYNSGGSAVLNFDPTTGSLALTGTVTANSSSVIPTTALSGTINGGTQIAANTVTGDRLVIDSITTRELAANSVTSVEILAGSITGGSLTAGSITGTQIAAGSITSTHLTATAIDGITITGTTVRTAAPGGTAGRVEMSALTNTMSVFMKPFTNLVTNPSFEVNTTGWTTAASSLNAITASGGSIARAASGTAPDRANIGNIAVSGTGQGAAYEWSTRVFKAGVRYRLQLKIFGLVGAQQQTVTFGNSGAADSASGTANPDGTWQNLIVDWTPTADRTGAAITLTNFYFSTAQTNSIDAVIVIEDNELPPTATGYFDGATTGATWDGTADASTSTLNNVNYEVIRMDGRGGLNIYPITGSSSLFTIPDRYAISWKLSNGLTFAQLTSSASTYSGGGARGVGVSAYSETATIPATATLGANNTADTSRNVGISATASTTSASGPAKSQIQLASGGLFGVSRILYQGDFTSHYPTFAFTHNTIIATPTITQAVASYIDAGSGSFPVQTSIPAGSYLYLLGGFRPSNSDTSADVVLVRFNPAGGGTINVISQIPFPGFAANTYSIVAGEFKLKVTTPSGVGNTSFWGMRLPIRTSNAP